MAYQFASASSQYMGTTSAPATTTPITMACWYNASAGGADQMLMALGATSGNFDRITLFSNASSAVAAQAVASGVVSLATAGVGTVGEWNHAAATYRAASKKAFVNGSGGTAETTAFTLSGVSELLIGGRTGSNGVAIYANGLIAEAGLWTEALTDAEILSLARGLTPDQIRPQSLVFYAPLIRTIQDLRGGRTITATNSPTVAVHPRVIQ